MTLKTVDIKGKRLTSAHKQSISAGLFAHYKDKKRGTVGKNGYRTITNGRGVRQYEHRLVWEEHHGPIPEGYEVHHKNEDRLDNRIQNLELMKEEEHGRLHALHRGLGTHERTPDMRRQIAETNKKCPDERILELKKQGLSQSEIGRLVGLGQPAISIRLSKLLSPSQDVAA